MASISSYSPLAVSANTNIFPVVEGGVNYRATRDQITTKVTADLAAEIATTDAEILALQNTRVLKAGDTMTGQLVLVGDPVLATQAASKGYIDTLIASRLTTSGGTMTGSLTLSGAPTAALHAATRQYVLDTRDNCVRKLENYNPTTTSAYPALYDSSAIQEGASFYVTVAGSIGPAVVVALEIGDILIARQDDPLNVHAHWAIVNANQVAASTTEAGRIEIATDAEAVAKTATNVALVPSNFATGNFASSASFEGLIEIATATEFTNGTDTTRAITSSIFNTAQTDYQLFVGLQHVLAYSAGTWTRTRIAAGDYVQRHTVAAETTIIGIDVSNFIRTTSNRGYQLNSFDVIARNNTADLVAYTITLRRVDYTDSGLVTPVSIALTGTLPLTQDADPRVTNITVDTPVFHNNSLSKYIIEVSVQTAALSAYDWIGIVLRMSKSGI